MNNEQVHQDRVETQLEKIADRLDFMCGCLNELTDIMKRRLEIEEQRYIADEVEMKAQRNQLF
jgi:hypothetical protein